MLTGDKFKQRGVPRQHASGFFFKEGHVASASLPRRDGLSVIRSGLGALPAVVKAYRGWH